MSHALVVGMTESGKTTFARGLSHIYKRGNEPVLVLDELRDPGWAADFITGDPDEFLKVFWSSRGCFVFIDEAGDSVGKYDEAMRKTATRGRHWGHSCYFCVQRGALLSTTVRGQCRHLFLFTSPVEDVKIYAKEWNKPELLTSENLAWISQPGHYLHVPRYGDVTRGQLW